MQATRQETLDYIRRHGETTVRDLGGLLDLTPTGIRQHLSILERDGLVAVRDIRGRVGRPAFVYSLTPAGDALFPNRYDELSNHLLDEIRAIAASKGLQSVLMRVAERNAEPYEAGLRDLPLAQRVDEATRLINERGSVTDSRSNNAEEYLINQYTCPFPTSPAPTAASAPSGSSSCDA